MYMCGLTCARSPARIGQSTYVNISLVWSARCSSSPYYSCNLSGFRDSGRVSSSVSLIRDG